MNRLRRHDGVVAVWPGASELVFLAGWPEAGTIDDEFRVKHVSEERIQTTGLRVKPNFRAVAPRLGASTPLVVLPCDPRTRAPLPRNGATGVRPVCIGGAAGRRTR